MEGSEMNKIKYRCVIEYYDRGFHIEAGEIVEVESVEAHYDSYNQRLSSEILLERDEAFTEKKKQPFYASIDVASFAICFEKV